MLAGVSLCPWATGEQIDMSETLSGVIEQAIATGIHWGQHQRAGSWFRDAIQAAAAAAQVTVTESMLRVLDLRLADLVAQYNALHLVSPDRAAPHADPAHQEDHTRAAGRAAHGLPAPALSDALSSKVVDQGIASGIHKASQLCALRAGGWFERALREAAEAGHVPVTDVMQRLLALRLRGLVARHNALHLVDLEDEVELRDLARQASDPEPLAAGVLDGAAPGVGTAVPKTFSQLAVVQQAIASGIQRGRHLYTGSCFDRALQEAADAVRARVPVTHAMLRELDVRLDLLVARHNAMQLVSPAAPRGDLPPRGAQGEGAGAPGRETPGLTDVESRVVDQAVALGILKAGHLGAGSCFARALREAAATARIQTTEAMANELEWQLSTLVRNYDAMHAVTPDREVPPPDLPQLEVEPEAVAAPVVAADLAEPGLSDVQSRVVDQAIASGIHRGCHLHDGSCFALALHDVAAAAGVPVTEALLRELEARLRCLVARYNALRLIGLEGDVPPPAASTADAGTVPGGNGPTAPALGDALSTLVDQAVADGILKGRRLHVGSCFDQALQEAADVAGVPVLDEMLRVLDVRLKEVVAQYSAMYGASPSREGPPVPPPVPPLGGVRAAGPPQAEHAPR